MKTYTEQQIKNVLKSFISEGLKLTKAQKKKLDKNALEVGELAFLIRSSIRIQYNVIEELTKELSDLRAEKAKTSQGWFFREKSIVHAPPDYVEKWKAELAERRAKVASTSPAKKDKE
jgi:hypothetical protein